MKEQKELKEEKEVLTIEEAAKIMYVSKNGFMQRYLKTGLIPILVFHDKQKRPKIWRKDVMEFIENSRRIMNPELTNDAREIEIENNRNNLNRNRKYHDQ